MTPIDLIDAQDRLPELLVRIAGGEQFILTDGGKWAALLAPPPPPPPSPEELAAAQARAEEAVRTLVQMWIDEGHSPPPESKLWEIMRRRP